VSGDTTGIFYYMTSKCCHDDWLQHWTAV